MSSLTGKIAIVTASSRGIGRAIALRLGRDGAAVVVNYVSPDKAEALVQDITAQGGRAIMIQGSVANRADVVAFLVGDDAHWMTGQNIQVNGGIL